MTASDSPPNPPAAKSPSLWRQNRRLIAAIAATVVTVLAIGSGVVALLGAPKHGAAKTDERLVALLSAADQADRALYTELSDRLYNAETGREPNTETLDLQAEALAQAAASFGVDRLNLGQSEADQQTKLFLEDPMARIEAARAELRTGTAVGAELPATFDTSREALRNLAVKAADLFSNQPLADKAEAFAAAMDPALPVSRSDQTPPAGEPRAEALNELAADVELVADDANMGPVILAVLCGILALGAVALWVVLALKGKDWAAQRPAAEAPGPKGAPPPAPAQPAAPPAPAPANPAAAPAPAPAQPAAAPAPAPAQSAAAPAPAPAQPTAAPAPVPDKPAAAPAPANPAAAPAPAKQPRIPFAPTTLTPPASPA
ncbi:MAG: hypothetical protein LBD51_05465, partial [Bifidobacteriaceae bacterium]|nr:hypothetical protein [Bifidobacteriaceae bacterium]